MRRSDNARIFPARGGIRTECTLQRRGCSLHHHSPSSTRKRRWRTGTAQPLSRAGRREAPGTPRPRTRSRPRSLWPRSSRAQSRLQNGHHGHMPWRSSTVADSAETSRTNLDGRWGWMLMVDVAAGARSPLQPGCCTPWHAPANSGFGRLLHA